MTIKAAAEKLFPGIEANCMGSFRRGAVSSHDVDVLLVHREYQKRVPEGGLLRVLQVIERWISRNGCRRLHPPQC